MIILFEYIINNLLFSYGNSILNMHNLVYNVNTNIHYNTMNYGGMILTLIFTYMISRYFREKKNTFKNFKPNLVFH